jgi:hypothetical protein
MASMASHSLFGDDSMVKEHIERALTSLPVAELSELLRTSQQEGSFFDQGYDTEY